LPRKTRKRLLGRFEAADRAALERDLRRLRREVHAVQRERQRRVDEYADDAADEPDITYGS
jgi:hypothetical protein